MTSSDSDFHVSVEIEEMGQGRGALVVVKPGIDPNGRVYAGVGREVRKCLAGWEDGNWGCVLRRCDGLQSATVLARQVVEQLRQSVSHVVVDGIDATAETYPSWADR
jgi:hypothetical protein